MSMLCYGSHACAVACVIALVSCTVVHGVATRCPASIGSPDFQAGDKVKIAVDASTGCFTVVVDSKSWFVSAPPSFKSVNQVGGIQSTSRRSWNGSDSIGEFVAFDIGWSISNQSGDEYQTYPVWQTTFKSYSSTGSLSAIVFEQAFLDSVILIEPGEGDWGTPQSSFPNIDTQQGIAPTLGSVSFSGQGQPTYASSLGSLAGEAEGFRGGVPIIMTNPQDLNTAVLSPISQFLSTTTQNSARDGVLYFGIEGRASYIGAGYSSSVILQFGGARTGLTETVMNWGSNLLRMYNKDRTPPNINAHVERLGYSTVGHYFYGTEVNKNAEQTVRGIKDEALAKNIPFGWYLLDSWWYGEGPTPTPSTFNGSTKFVEGYGGTWRWDDTVARSHGFPSGLRNLTDYLGAPLVMHMGQLVGSAAAHGHPVGPGPPTPNFGAPPYATDSSFPGQKGWVVEPQGSLPLGDDGGAAFWEFLFKDAADWGLLTFKLDHTETQIPDMNVTQNNVNTVETWLTSMTRTAEKYGIYKQYGGCVPSMMLHSVTLPSATTARVGPDYIPGQSRPKDSCMVESLLHSQPLASAEGSAKIAQNSLVWWALGVRPYKDATFTGYQTWSTTTCMQGSTNSDPYLKPEWWGLQDPAPALGVIVSALAAGPVASCDGIGDVNRNLLMRTAREDGVLLKPSRPALALDSVWLGGMFGASFHGAIAGSGEVSATFTELQGHSNSRWYEVLAWGDLRSSISPISIGLADVVNQTGARVELGALWGTRLVAWSEGGSNGGAPPVMESIKLVDFSQENPLTINSSKAYGDFTLWHVAPVLCNGMVLLGEIEKVVPISPQRISQLDVDCDKDGLGITLKLLGGPEEIVNIVFRGPPPLFALSKLTCTVNPTGIVIVKLPVRGDPTCNF